MWRSDEHEPLLCREVLLGIDAVPPSRRDRIQRHLASALEARGGLLHANNAFNVMYFDYDPAARRYRAEPDPDAFVEVAIGGSLPVLPSGAFVRLTRGAREVWGEVAAVFGSRAAVEPDGWTAASLSGAPAGDLLDEQRVVIDTQVFGPLSVDEAVEQGRWLRPGGGFEGGHLVGGVPALSGEVSARDQIGAFAQFLAGSGRPLLDLGPLPRWLEQDADAAVVERAVRAAVTCVADIMRSAGSIRGWGLYGRSARGAKTFAATDLADEVRAAVVRPAPGGGARYSALWPLLHTLTTRGRDGLDALAGVAGAAAVVDANLVLADIVSDGRQGDGIDLRVDDQWQQGGIWRAQSVPTTSLLDGLDPLVPAGIGFAEVAGAEAAKGVNADDGVRSDAGRVHVEHIDDELVVLTVALSKADLSAGRLELTGPVKKLLPTGSLVLRLHHDGDDLEAGAGVQPVHPGWSGVAGVSWPPSMYPGIRLTVAAARAGRRLVATSIRYPDPVIVDGFGPVRWECDWELFAEGTTLADAFQLSPAEQGRWQPSVARSAWRPAVASLEHLIVESLKRDGDDGPAGSRALDGRRLTAALFGPDTRSPALLWTVIHTCEDMAVLGMLTRAAAPRGGPDVFTWWPDTPEAQDAREAGIWGDGDTPGDPMSRHWVRPRERRLPSGQQASPQSKSDYARWRMEVEGLDADTELPAGTTFVHGHLRGNGKDKPWHRHVPQHQERRSRNG
ncbi:hypothetical protein [Streptomyces goshikiensis]